MLSYNQQYDISNGIFITYDSQLDYRLLHSNHKKGTRDNLKNYFPYHKWESKTKELFVLSCLYIIFTKTPSSYRAMVNELREVDIKEVSKFKNKIMNYQDYIGKDIHYLKEKVGSSIDQQTVIKEYLNGNIEFYTAWWYVKFNKTEWNAGRTFSHVMRKLKFIMLFLTFKEDSVMRINELFKQLDI